MILNRRLRNYKMDTAYKKSLDNEKRMKELEEPKFSKAGLSVLEKRYLQRDDITRELTETPKELVYRVANVLSRADALYPGHNIRKTEKEFYDLMASEKFLPNSPTLRGAGLGINLAACYVLPVEDSRDGIFREGLANAVEIQAFGGGTGFNFSNLRAKGSLINSTKGVSSGIISFMKVYANALGKTIQQGGVRDGANMGILRYNHPEIESFITCKRDVTGKKELSSFNLSVGVYEDFMRKVISSPDELIPIIDHKGREVKRIAVKDLFEEIVKSAWISGDPGLIYLDRINASNPTPQLGNMVATNPCGEQPLLDYEACNLGSINLSKILVPSRVQYSSRESWEKRIDWAGLEKTVHSAVHLLDNVIDVNDFPLKKSPKYQKELETILINHISDKQIIERIIEEYSQSPIEKIVKGNRKIGLGVMGFADLLISLGITYGSDQSYEVADKLMDFISKKSKESSVNLAKVRGVFPNFDGSVYDPKSQYFKGKESRQRNALLTTIAPTGTLSTLLGVNGGIEPLFALAYTRNAVYNENGTPTLNMFIVDKNFERIAKEEGFFSPELLKEIAKNNGSLEGVRKPLSLTSQKWREIRELFVTANDLHYKEHITMQDTFQRRVDNAISKTINLPSNATMAEIRGAYLMTLDTTVKGITVYKDGSIENQPLSASERQEIEMGGRPKVDGTTIKQKTPFGTAFITLNNLKDRPDIPFESFITIGKGGKDINAIAEGYGRILSLTFKKGTSVDEVAEQLKGISGESASGIGPSKIKSLPDAIAIGLLEANSQITGKPLKNGKTKEGEEQPTISKGEQLSGNFCPSCGSKLLTIEGCQKCTDPECGFSKC